MRKLSLSLIASMVLLLSAVPLSQAPAQEAAPEATSCVEVGYGDADATWHVGVSAGQYSGDRIEGQPDPEQMGEEFADDPQGFVENAGKWVPQPEDLEGGSDPHAHHVRRARSYGVQSRLNIRAIVIKGCNGEHAVLVKNDSYLAQDLVQRRMGQILEAEGSAVGYEDVLVAATHNHNSPYVTSPSWGLAVFQDTFDGRMLEYMARQHARAILEAEANLQPAVMGATEVKHDIYKANIPGPERADDETPGGYPRSFGDLDVVVMRFDNAQTGAPIASWVNWGQHPESLDTTNLISADYLGPLERMVERETGAPMVFSQADVGSSEGPYDGWDAPPRWLPDGTRRAWAHIGFAQTERGVRYLADSIKQGFAEIGAGGGTVPYSGDFPVAVYNGWIPGPISHPYPSVWNCKNEQNVEGHPRAGVAPTCEEGPDAPWAGDPQAQMIWENLKQHGIPVPDHYDGPGFGAVEENLRLRLQAVRIGEVILGSCACEAQVDLILNFESRADDKVGNIWDGYDWNCRRDGYVPGSGEPSDDIAPADDPVHIDHQWTCDWPDSPSGTRQFTFSDYEYERMQAEIHNDAEGWNEPDYAPFANSEPYKPSEIKGNFTKEELDGEAIQEPDEETNVLPTTGYKLAVGIGHAGDYNGYTVSYREYQNRDSYRKALTDYGPHTADYMSTHLVYMAQALKGGPDVIAEDPYYALQAADEARQVAFSQAAGRSLGAAYDAWYAALPSDANAGQILEQPEDIKRFDAATFTWTGGSNAVDNPTVVVQRKEGDTWVDYADQTGEVQTFLKFPEAGAGTANTYAGQEQWEWTANFEAFNFGPRTDIDPRGVQVPEGTYRFVVEGTFRSQALTDSGYDLTSREFTVSKWDGIKVADFRTEPGGVSFTVEGARNLVETSIAPGHAAPEIRYPRTYDAHEVIRFIGDDGRGDICKTCTFRPWATGSNVDSATVTVERADGTVEQVPATRRNGRWQADVALYDGDSAYVARGGIVDTFGEINGSSSDRVAGSGPRPTPTPTQTPTEPPAPEVTTLTSSGASSGQHSDEALLQATLTDADGDPLAGRDVVFELTGTDSSRTFNATTDDRGIASVSPVLTEKPGAFQLVARFAGDDAYLGSADVDPFVVEREDSGVELSVAGQGNNLQLTARLFDADTTGSGIAGRKVDFYAGETLAGSATTDSNGVAVFRPPSRHRGAKDWEARFEGDEYYEPSRNRAV